MILSWTAVIPETEKQCACGHKLVKVGEDVSEKLQYIPSQIYVLRTVRPKYACRNCEGSGDEDKPVFRQADAPHTIVPKSIAGASLLAAVFTNKYELHLPYYRQEKAFEHRMIGISRQDMSSWQETVYKAALPLEKLLMAHIKSGKVLHMDETTVQILHYEKAENEEEAEKDENRDKSYMWLARGGPEETPAVVYRYFKTRSASHVKEFINGFSGFLMTDGYKGYSAALKEHERSYPEETITHACCLAHARRKFNDALKAGKSESAKAALSFIQKIYAKEAELRGNSSSDDDFLMGRKKEVQPLFDRFKEWLTDKHEHAVNSGKFGEAVSYMLEYWDLILNYLLSSELTPDNNTAENAVRPFICGRNYVLTSFMCSKTQRRGVKYCVA
jgi:transposase